MRLVTGLPAALCLLLGGAARAAETDAKDPLAADVARWSASFANAGGTGEILKDTRASAGPVLAKAEEALRDGRRLLALQRLAAVRANLAAAEFVSGRTAEARSSAAAFEAEWDRMGRVLAPQLGPPSASALAGVEPAAVRAFAEASLPQVRALYEASLEYGRNTMPEVGLDYIGSAAGQRDLAAFCRTLAAPSSLRPPPVRALDPEADALETELLSAYRPPASIDRHQEFILASALLKEARELNGAGLRYGALLRLLQAWLRLGPVLRAGPAPSTDEVRAGLRAMEERLGAGVDHTLGRLFVEIAEADLEAATPEKPAANALTVVTEVLPRYLAALGPPPALRPKVPPEATITLVRWPYT